MSNGDRDPVFYYSRSSRLNRSNDEQPNRRRPVKTSVAARANIMVFASIIVICVMFGISSRMSAKQDFILGANTLNLKVVEEEGVLILNIKKKAPKSGEVYIGAVDISVSQVEAMENPTAETTNAPVGGAPIGAAFVFSHRITFNPVAAETYRVSLPFEGSDFFVTLKAADEQKSIRIKL